MLTSFATLLAAIGLGVLLAHVGLITATVQRALAEISFMAATPALMFLTISDLDLGEGITGNLLAAVGSLLAAGGAYALIARLVWRLDLGSVLIGALSSGYVNAGNLGVAVAAYIVGDTAVVVPTLLVQLLVVQPVTLAVLEHRSGRGGGDSRFWRRLLVNPLTIASMLGLVVALTGVRLPEFVVAPLDLIAGFAIPAMLFAYGASLRLSPPMGRSGHNREVALASVLKLVVQPVVAAAIAVACGLEGTALLGVVMTAALPTAQNIFLHATRYRVGEAVARETILLTTLCCLPISLLIALVFG